MTRNFEIVDRVREDVLRALEAQGFNCYSDGTPFRSRTPLRTFESMMGLDEAGEVGALKRMMAEGSGPYGNADAAPPEMTEEVAAKLLATLRPHVDDAAYERYARVLRDLVDAASGSRQAADQPPPFPGRPRPGGEKDPIEFIDLKKRPAMDSSFDKMFPGAARVEAADPYGQTSRRSPQPRVDAAAKAPKGKTFDDFFPGADRIGKVA